MHPFVTWLVENHRKADTPVGDLARDLDFAPQSPTTGGRKELRTHLEDMSVATWALDVFDEAWAAYESVPTCLSPGCAEKAAGGASCFCAAHGGRSHQAGGS